MSLVIDPYRFGTFDPLTSITWHAVYWASDPSWSNPGDGNAVSTWRDGSGNARDATSSGANRPLYRASYAGLNSQPAVEFDNSDDYLLTAAMTLTQPFSVVAIYAQAATGNANQLYQGKAAGGASATGSMTARASASAVTRLNNGTFLDGPASSTSANFQRGYSNGASSAIAVNESSPTTGNAGTNNLNNSSGVYLGIASDGASSPFNGGISFMGFYAGNITADGQWSALKSWAATTYGITI